MTRWFERVGICQRIAEPLVVALFLTSVSVILEHYTPAFEWIDVAMLAIDPAGFMPSPPSEPGSEILVVTIGPRFFEAEFGGQTPIPRAAFKQLLTKIVSAFQPQVLALDYDLSPGCGDLAKGQRDQLDCGSLVARDLTGHEQLNRYLLSLTKPLGKKPPPVQKLVLVRPVPVVDPVLCTLRRDWERRMRDQGGVVFGDADLVHHGLFDTVVKYETKPESFARRAHCSVRAWASDCANDSGGADTRGAAAASIEREKCDTREKLKDRPVDRAHLRPLNFLGAMASIRLCPVRGFESFNQCARIHGNSFPVVFVGADYDESDIFNTPLGQTPGVALHAYATYSMRPTHRLKERRLLAALFDVVIGTFVGGLLHYTWGHFARYGLAMRLLRATLSFALLSGAWVGIMFVTRWVMLLGGWINPGPMISGVLIKTWHASVSRDHALLAPRGWNRYVGILYCLAWVGVVQMAIIIIGSELIGPH